MAFRNYYVGYDNKGFEFYSKKDLMDFLNQPEVKREALRKDYQMVTIIKENDSSRVFYLLTENGLEFDYKEIMYDGAY